MPQRHRHAWTVIYHVQFYDIPTADYIYCDTYARVSTPAVPQRITAKIPHHLIQVAAVERDLRVGGQLEFEQRLRNFLDLAELFDKSSEIIGDPEYLSMCPLAAIELQYVVHHAIETLHVILNNRKQA